MKKLYLLLAASVLLCGTTMAQNATKAQLDKKFSIGAAFAPTKQAQNLQKDETPVWSCDFEATDYEIVEGNDEANGKDHWQMVTLSTFPSALADPREGRAYFQPFIWRNDTLNETPGHWALVDLLSDYPQFGGTGQVAEKAWIQFTMDLSATTSPKICFYQLYRPLNRVSAHIKVSIDGGATWTDHLINDEIASNDYAPLYKEVVISEAAGQSNVAIRFQQEATGEGLQGYGWQIDDIKIVEVPAHNLTMNDARVSMFGYFDFRNVPAEYWTEMTDAEKRDYAYQIYDPYAQSPAANWETSSGFAAFNVEYTNNGTQAVAPKVNIVVTSPSGAELYNKTLTGASIALTQRDTIDFGTIDDDNMANSTIFYFENEIELGRYTVTFTVSEEGAEDADPSDNTIEQYFYITETSYSKSYYEPTSRFTAMGYQSSASGDMYGAQFTYYYSPDDIMSTDIYIAEGTTPGTQVKAALYHYNSDAREYVLQRESEWLTVEDENIGTWNNFVFTNDYNFTFSTDEQYREVTVMAVAAWDNDDDDLYFGISDVLTSKKHSSMMYFNETWYYGSDDIALNFHNGIGVIDEGEGNGEGEGEFVSSFSANGIEMFPNPSNGIVNFSNVENATIEVYNMMGQVVASMNNVEDNTSIDLSGIANGNYVVRIVKDGAIATSKLNITK